METNSIPNKNSNETVRLESFSDGVIAVIITIMVLNLKIPRGWNLVDLQSVLPIFLVYILSFQTVGTFWNNHHHLLRAANYISTRIMWSNMFFLFCLSLIPFSTAWLGENYTKSWPTALYGIILLLTGASIIILQQSIVERHEYGVEIVKNLGNKFKGKFSVVCYVLAIPLAFYFPFISDVLYILTAVMWFIPQRLEISKDK